MLSFDLFPTFLPEQYLMVRSHFRDRLRSPRPKCNVLSPTTLTLCSAPVDSLFFIPLSQAQSFVLDCFGCFAFRTLLKDPHSTSHLRCWLMPRDSPVLRESFRASPHRVPSVPCPSCVPSTTGTACCCFAPDFGAASRAGHCCPMCLWAAI